LKWGLARGERSEGLKVEKEWSFARDFRFQDFETLRLWEVKRLNRKGAKAVKGTQRKRGFGFWWEEGFPIEDPSPLRSAGTSF
jgi:hypothetical protein